MGPPMAGSSPNRGSARWKELTRSFRFRASLCVLVAVLLAATVVLFVEERGVREGASPTASPTTVRIEGVEVLIRPGETVGEALRSIGQRPKPGRVLDVTGKPIPGQGTGPHILLNGQPARMSSPLVPGDLITVQPGTDRTEGTMIERKRVPGRVPGDPQFTVSRWHMLRIAQVGRISGELAGLRFHPVGTPRTPREVALTFDDGPSPTWTPKVLAVLARYHVPATFFLIGQEAQRYPRLVRAETKAGMMIGNHSWDHPITPPFNEFPRAAINSEMSATNAEFAKLGVHTHLFRPPGGTYSPALIAAAQENGLRIVLWNVDPRDWDPGVSSRAIVANVLANVRAGSIVELHDGGGDRSATVRALPSIIKGIRKMGLKLVSL